MKLSACVARDGFHQRTQRMLPNQFVSPSLQRLQTFYILICKDFVPTFEQALKRPINQLRTEEERIGSNENSLAEAHITADLVAIARGEADDSGYRCL